MKAGGPDRGLHLRRVGAGRQVSLPFRTRGDSCLEYSRTYVLPVGPKSPPSLGIQVIKYGDVAPAPLPSVYSFSHESVAVTD